MKYGGDDPAYKAIAEQIGPEHNDRELFALPGSFLLFAKECRYIDSEGCKELLFEAFQSKDWKRVWKKTYTIDSNDDTATYRGFQSKSTGKIVTIGSFNYATYIFDFNLKDAFSEIDQIVAFVKKHYVGCDYTSVWYNPVTKIVWFPMGDGGSYAFEDISELDFSDEDAMDELFCNGDEGEIPSAYLPENNLDFVVGSRCSDEWEPERACGYVPVGFYKGL